jgi:hypothetical protein
MTLHLYLSLLLQQFARMIDVHEELHKREVKVTQAMLEDATQRAYEELGKHEHSANFFLSRLHRKTHGTQLCHCSEADQRLCLLLA